nr:immunoglobulin heavy chain junction region [Mus musculus]MBK4198073.1 immunoglobulin heavy chain junction region [Mus musculus]MBK4198074.1 immunoglobulin heavy chain junction region [Mus musculus]
CARQVYYSNYVGYFDYW